VPWEIRIEAPFFFFTQAGVSACVIESLGKVAKRPTVYLSPPSAVDDRAFSLRMALKRPDNCATLCPGATRPSFQCTSLVTGLRPVLCD